VKRQRLRRGILLIAFLLFVPTFFLFSPWHLYAGAAQGIVPGSMFVFLTLFLSSLFLGRAYCGWACCGSGLQEACALARDDRVRGGRFNLLKWLWWTPWIGTVIYAAFRANGFHEADFFLDMEQGLSVTDWHGYICYYSVIGLILIPALVVGKRAFCHYICWMAPFMILGRRLRNLLRWPSLHLESDKEACTECGDCTANCPMSLDVDGMVRKGEMEDLECILCGMCVDSCPSDAIRYGFFRSKKDRS